MHLEYIIQIDLNLKIFQNQKLILVPTSKTTKDFDAQYVTSDKLDGQSDAK